MKYVPLSSLNRSKSGNKANTTSNTPYSLSVHFFKGKRMNFSGLQNDYVVRLLPKGVKYEELNVHEKVHSSSKRLKGNLLHYTYKNAMHRAEI